MKLADFLKLVVAGSLITAVTACSTVNTRVGGLLKLDTDLTLTFMADADINPDDKNTPSPLFIRMYELKSDKQFSKADFIDLFERDGDALGADMIAKHNLKRIIPGEVRKEYHVLDPQTRYVGLLAEFLQYKDSTFKVIIPIAPTNVIESSSTVHVSGNTISAQCEKEMANNCMNANNSKSPRNAPVTTTTGTPFNKE